MTDKISAFEWRKGKKVPQKKRKPAYSPMPAKSPAQTMKDKIDMAKKKPGDPVRGKFAYLLGVESGMAKAASYVPDSHRMQSMIENHRLRGHEAELERLKAKHRSVEGRKGAGTGARKGALLGALGGIGLGVHLNQGGDIDTQLIRAAFFGGTGALIGAGMGAIKGRRLGAEKGRAEAERRHEAVKATRDMGTSQKQRYFHSLAQERRGRGTWSNRSGYEPKRHGETHW